jgi:putative membrane protein
MGAVRGRRLDDPQTSPLVRLIAMHLCMAGRANHYLDKTDHPAKDKLETEILANERTFLAWVRTSIAVMTLGFVIAKFSVWMRQMSAQLAPKDGVHRLGVAVPLGEVMIGVGALLTAFAAWRFHVVKRAIERGEIKADPRMVFAITAIIVGAAIAVIIYMALSAEAA